MSKYLQIAGGAVNRSVALLPSQSRSMLASGGSKMVEFTDYKIISEGGVFAKFSKLPFLKIVGKGLGWAGDIYMLYSLVEPFLSGKEKNHPFNLLEISKTWVPNDIQNLLLCPHRLQHLTVVQICSMNAMRLLTLDANTRKSSDLALSYFVLPVYLRDYPYGAECFTPAKRSSIMKLFASAFMQLDYPQQGITDDDYKNFFSSFDETDDTPDAMRRIKDFIAYVLLSSAENTSPELAAEFLDSDGHIVPHAQADADHGFAELLNAHHSSEEGLVSLLGLTGILVKDSSVK
jgi:hypothetical protein